MKKYLIFSLLLLGAGCVAEAPVEVPPVAEPEAMMAPEDVKYDVALPVEGFADHRTFKVFGQFVDDRFYGYHSGDDVEVDDVAREYPVYAIANGTVTFAGTIGGYGGVIVIAHEIDDETISSIYGHVDIARAAVNEGDSVVKGQEIAMLGDHESTETDGERKHIHFGLYEGSEVRFKGYVPTKADLEDWIDPSAFFQSHGYNFD